MCHVVGTPSRAGLRDIAIYLVEAVKPPSGNADHSGEPDGGKARSFGSVTTTMVMMPTLPGQKMATKDDDADACMLRRTSVVLTVALDVSDYDA